MKILSGGIVGVFGLPCSGKSTIIQAIMNSSRVLMACISTGDIARKLSTKDDIKHMADGNLFPHEDSLRKEVLSTINKRRASGAELIFLDGFPRFDDQVKWMLENQLVGTIEDGCLIQIIGEKLENRAVARMRNDQDNINKFKLKVAEQENKIYTMEKIIHRHALPYYCILNTNLEMSVKMIAKFIGIRK